MPATIAILIETIDRHTGATIKSKPRVITKNAVARVQIHLKATSLLKQPVLPLELFNTNKTMGRILLRRGGETIAVGRSSLSPACLPTILIIVNFRHGYGHLALSSVVVSLRSML